MGFSRQEYWSGLPFPSPGDLPKPGIEPRSPALWADALPSEPSGNPILKLIQCPRYYFLEIWFQLFKGLIELTWNLHWQKVLVPRGCPVTGNSGWAHWVEHERKLLDSLKSINNNLRSQREGFGSERIQANSWMLLLMMLIGLDPRHCPKCWKYVTHLIITATLCCEYSYYLYFPDGITGKLNNLTMVIS